ncbi:helix-turn-helix domain-containing protein [Rheinheimera sp. UJ63]|uniref:helix-turn-helix domain-containing protein n=1 Tax=Rheinheimera sp. UJ63 TaxID=2910157 RepID=UPI001F16E6C5|nr:helix-turn-helix transcriptional regulator [Rheinheimera sp. UJ63]MCF4010990.1 helix-turn-helix transcriptional regulator [Rheinheimera sp. UJ63]
MAQQSIQLIKSFLKHLRTQQGQTQEAIAEVCEISLRQYQNVEKTGCTTKSVISRLANYFGCSVNELIKNEIQDSSLWYIKRSESKCGQVVDGYVDALAEIQKQAIAYPNELNPKLKITDGAQVKEISVGIDNNEHKWVMRPIKFNENIGLLWTELTEWQQETWQSTCNKLLYGCVEHVFLDGKPLVPEGVTPKFIVEFIETGKGKKIDTGYRIFDSSAEFRASFSQWLETVIRTTDFSHFGNGELNIFYGFKDEMSKSVNIYKGWVNGDGEIIKAPWSAANIESLIDTMNKIKRGAGYLPLPIGIGENFEGDEPPPFEAEIKLKKETKIPDIDFCLYPIN